MLSEVVEKALNDQLNNELYSSYMYMALAAYFDRRSLTGFSHWMRLQAKEEMMHAMKLYEFIDDQDGKLELREVKAPPQEFGSAKACMQLALNQEQDNTEQINDIYELAVKNAEHATQVFMQWFISEQVEEEKSARQILERLDLAGEDGAALLVLDNELSTRSGVIDAGGA